MLDKIKNIFMPEEIIVESVPEEVVEVPVVEELPAVELPAVEVAPVVEAPVEVIANVVKATSTEFSPNDWTITVSDKEGTLIQKFTDLTEAIEFARDNGYTFHAE